MDVVLMTLRRKNVTEQKVAVIPLAATFEQFTVQEIEKSSEIPTVWTFCM
jgi:hypothetical protein